MKEKEYEILCERMKSTNEIRNNLLTFSFTSVLAILGVAFTDSIDAHPMIYLLPFFLIIPFTARITYYRFWEARINACIYVFGKELDISRRNGNKVEELRGSLEKLIGTLVNYEMFILSLACIILFYIKYPIQFYNFQLWDWTFCAVPPLLSLLVFFIIKSARNYEKIHQRYIEDWEESKEIYIDKITTI